MPYYGGDANDNIYNNTNTTQYGGNGDDRLHKDNASLYAYGGESNDLLWQGGNYTLEAYGGYGNDWIVSDSANSPTTGYGDTGNDAIWGGGGSDHLYGGQERDFIQGRAGNDAIYGGEGDDNSAGSFYAGAYAIGANSYTTTMGGLYGGVGNDYIEAARAMT